MPFPIYRLSNRALAGFFYAQTRTVELAFRYLMPVTYPKHFT